MSLLDQICQPWLITPEGFERVMRDAAKRDAVKPGASSLDIVVENPRDGAAIDDNGIAHIHVSGVIGHRLSWIEKALGNTDVCDVRREADAAVEAGASGLFLRIDSPGGAVVGTVECADYLAELGLSLPIFSYSNTVCASSGYWMGSSARQMWSSPSAMVGSIGVLFPWVDKSAAWAQAGISFQPLTNLAAIYKSAGHGPSLTDDQRAELQQRMERIFSLFQDFVCQQRPNADLEAMQGQAFLGLDALAFGLIDGIGTIEEAYSALCFEAGVFPRDVDLSEALSMTFQNGISLAPENKKSD